MENETFSRNARYVKNEARTVVVAHWIYTYLSVYICTCVYVVTYILYNILYTYVYIIYIICIYQKRQQEGGKEE